MFKHNTLQMLAVMTACLMLMPQAAAGNQWDGTGALVPESGAIGVDLSAILSGPDFENVEGQVAPGVGQGVMTWHGASDCGGDYGIRNYHFTFETTLGTVKGSGINEVATWMWNGLQFVGTVSAGFGFYPQGAWTDTGATYSLSGESPVSGVSMYLSAFGTAAGTYTQTTC